MKRPRQKGSVKRDTVSDAIEIPMELAQTMCSAFNAALDESLATARETNIRITSIEMVAYEEEGKTRLLCRTMGEIR